MSATDTDLASQARRILEDAGRPLSVRRIHRLLPEPAPDYEALRDALEAATVNGGGLAQIRRGVYSLGEAKPKPEPAADEAPRRRRRRRTRPTDMVGDDPATSLTVEGAVAEAESTPDRDALRRKLWDKMRASAAAVIAREPPDSSPPIGAEPED